MAMSGHPWPNVRYNIRPLSFACDESQLLNFVKQLLATYNFVPVNKLLHLHDDYNASIILKMLIRIHTYTGP
jgi:hypothetical protein